MRPFLIVTRFHGSCCSQPVRLPIWSRDRPPQFGSTLVNWTSGAKQLLYATHPISPLSSIFFLNFPQLFRFIITNAGDCRAWSRFAQGVLDESCGVRCLSHRDGHIGWGRFLDELLVARSAPQPCYDCIVRFNKCSKPMPYLTLWAILYFEIGTLPLETSGKYRFSVPNEPF